jgi:hypothetical protein
MPGIFAWHSVAYHLHRRWRYRLVTMRHLHRTAVQNERKREDDGKQSLVQPDMHCKSRAKSGTHVHRIIPYA